MGKRVYESHMLVTGDANGGLRALKLTDAQLNKVEKSLNTVNRSNKQFSKGLKGSTGGFLDFRAAALSITSIGLASYFFKAADTVKNIDARLRIVTGSTKEFAFAQSELFRISQSTYASLDSTARLYTRMQQSLGDLTVTQSQLLSVTGAVNQAFAVSGANAAEANAAIIQLTQGLASGQLRGEEFRSIAEQATRILQILQDELGATRGELIKMAHAGELTSDLVIDAMLNQSAVLQSEFDKLPLTMDRAFTKANNNIMKIIGDFDRATNATGIFAEAIVLLSESLDNIAVFVGIGVVAKLAAMLLRSAVAARAYVVTFGLAETATLGLTLGVQKLNRAFSLLGGVWGIALFAGYEFFSWLSENQAGVAEFSDEYAEAMALVKKATEDGFSVDDIGTFKQGLKDSGIEMQRLTAEVLKFQQVRDSVGSLDSRIKETIDNGGSIRMMALVDSTNYYNQSITALKAKQDELNESINQQIDYLRRADENFTLADEAVIRYTAAIQSADPLQSALNTTLGFAKNALGSVLAVQNKANKSLEDWLLKAGAQSDKLKEQIATFGKSKSELLEYQIAQINTTGASNDMKDAFIELSSEMVKQAQHLEELEKREEDAEDLAKIRAKRLKEEAKLRKSRMDEFRKNQKAALNELDPLAGIVDNFSSKFSNLWEVVADGSITIPEMLVAMSQLTSQMVQEASKIETVEGKVKDLLAEYDKEIAIAKAVGDSKLKLMAIRELEQLGLVATADLVAQLVAKYKELTVAQNGGGNGFWKDFGKNLDEYSGYVQAAANTAEAYNGVESRGDDGQSDFDAHRAAASERAAAGDYGPWAQFFAQFEQIIQGLSGGKLFGTPFELESATQTINLTDSGFDGQLTTTQVRERSWFRGREWRTIVEGLSEDAAASLESLYVTISSTLERASFLLGVNLTDLVTGTFTQEFDSEGNVTSSTSNVNGREYDEDIDAFSNRLLAENILNVVNAAFEQVEVTRNQRVLVGSYGGDEREGIEPFEVWEDRVVTQMIGQAELIAERWRDNAEKLLEGSQFLLAVAANFESGTNIFQSLVNAADFVEANTKPGEILIEAYNRIFASHNLWSLSLQQMGVDLGLTGDDFIKFSLDVVDAMGGLDAASESISKYFELFYTQEEMLTSRLAEARSNRDAALGEIGLDPAIALSEFRTQFEALADTLSPEELANWFAASDALYALNEQMRGLVAAEEEYLGFIAGFRAQLVELSGTDYQNQLAGLSFALGDNITQANNLAIAAGRSGAATEDLAVIQAAYVASVTQLTAKLRNEVLSLIDQLYGEDLDQRIQDLENSQVGSIGAVASAANSMYESQLSAVQAIHNVIDNLLINETLSPLSRTDQFGEAFGQFQELLAAAQGGDVDAMNALPGMANTLLTIARDVFASGSDYTDIFDTVIAGLQSIGMTLQPPTETGPQTTTLQVSGELAALYLEREMRDQEQLAQQRLELAQQLAIHLNDLAAAVNQPVLELAASLGVNMIALVTDLGVNLADLTTETGQQLGNVSNLLGVSLSELATSVGVDLGTLAQSQSIMNNALEAQLALLPTQSALMLQPFLSAIENATNEADANAAIAAMEAAIALLPADQANLLAPYFSGIEYQSEFDQQLALLQEQRDLEINEEALLNRIAGSEDEVNAELDTQTARLNTQITILGNINSGISGVITAIGNINTGGATQGGGPQFAKGIKKIKTDQSAYLHAGETVLPAYLVNGLEKFGLPLNNGGGGDKSTIKALSTALNRSQQQQAVMMEQFNRVMQQMDRQDRERTDKIVNAINQQKRTNLR